MTSSTKTSQPRIRSFIRRQGRSTIGQKNALDTCWNTYCLDLGKTYDFNQVFEQKAPLIVEIGFGNGSSLAEMAEANPDLN